MKLADQLGLEPRELISVVGGGGKSTVLFRLGSELAQAGNRVLLTTTTKMGRDQAHLAPTVCWSVDHDRAVASLDEPGPVLLIVEGDDHKIKGPPPGWLDEFYAQTTVDYIIVEADGSHGMPLKAPAGHEPVVPSATSLVLILMGMDAVGQPLGTVTHRVEEAIRFTGLTADHVLSPGDCASILSHPEGALRVCPKRSRVIVGLTKVETDTDRESARQVAAALADHTGIDLCIPVSLESPLVG